MAPDSYIAWRPTQQKQVMQDGMRLPSTTSIRPAKSLLMIPAHVVLAMQDEGWLLRSKIIRDMGFARPDSAKDRPTVVSKPVPAPPNVRRKGQNGGDVMMYWMLLVWIVFSTRPIPQRRRLTT
jgi:hypothetical protein